MPGAVALSQGCILRAQREPLWGPSLLNQARWQGENTKFNARRYLAHRLCMVAHAADKGMAMQAPVSKQSDTTSLSKLCDIVLANGWWIERRSISVRRWERIRRIMRYTHEPDLLRQVDVQ